MLSRRRRVKPFWPSMAARYAWQLARECMPDCPAACHVAQLNGSIKRNHLIVGISHAERSAIPVPAAQPPDAQLRQERTARPATLATRAGASCFDLVSIQ